MQPDEHDDVARQARFTALYERYHDDVLRFAHRRIGADHAQDVVHDTFLIVWRRLDDVPAHTRAWLLTITRNVIGNLLRSQRRLENAYLDAAAEPRQAPETPEDHVFGVDLGRAWAKLPMADREILALIAWDGLVPAEAAAVLGCTSGAYRVRLLRARRRLQDLLGRPLSPRHLNEGALR